MKKWTLVSIGNLYQQKMTNGNVGYTVHCHFPSGITAAGCIGEQWIFMLG